MTSRARSEAPFARRAEATRRPYTLAPAHRLSLEAVAQRSGMHPEMVRRLVALGLLDAQHDAEGRLWFAPSAPLTLARIQRLRAGFCLNYASLGLVLDLLDRIAVLEAALRRRGVVVGSDETPWT